jgi:hypothetical protein
MTIPSHDKDFFLIIFGSSYALQCRPNALKNDNKNPILHRITPNSTTTYTIHHMTTVHSVTTAFIIITIC